ncbi:MAG: hypothetical protein HN757_02385 [Calditrichaeota bacterium]|nr:hypothetical protein [Calditrichota bacterium]
MTITTVGYGDMIPQTPVGKLIGSGLILSGVILISTFTAAVSSNFVAEKIKEGKGLQTIKYKDHIIVCGAGRYCLTDIQVYCRIESTISSTGCIYWRYCTRCSRRNYRAISRA